MGNIIIASVIIVTESCLQWEPENSGIERRPLDSSCDL